jgi:hypothetical protein
MILLGTLLIPFLSFLFPRYILLGPDIGMQKEPVPIVDFFFNESDQIILGFERCNVESGFVPDSDVFQVRDQLMVLDHFD